ncbi:tectonin beta-propeller repeat-containing protein 1, partial [Mitosporidium daphniae]
MQLVLKGLNFKVIWIVISLFSENAANPFGSSIISAVGGYDSVEKIDPQLNFLRKKKQDILAFIGHFLMVAKRMQVLCNDIDNFLANPLGSVFELRVFVLCFVISKIKVSYLLMVLLNVALLWNWPPFMIFRGLSLYLYDSFLRFYFKKYFATVLIDRRVFWPVSVGNQNQNQWYIRIPTKAEILHRRILFFDLYDKTNNEIIRVLYLYENQRWWPGIGWTDMLKSTDRPRYSNESGSIGSSLLLPIEQQAL